MKQLTTLTFLILFFSSFGQYEAKITQILSAPHSSTQRISCENSLTTTILPCEFSGSTFDIETVKSSLKNIAVVKIYYVNTSYRSSPTFDQRALDVKRFHWLNTQFPEFFADPIIEWEVVEQKACTTSEEGETFFHGFVLVHRPALTEENRNKEIDALLTFIEHPEEGYKELDPLVNTLNRPSSSTSTATPKKIEEKNTFAKFKTGEYALYKHFQQTLINSPGINRDRLDLWVKVSFNVSETGEISNLTFLEDYPLSASDRVKNAFQTMSKWEPETENGQAVSTTIRLDIRVSYSGEVNGIYLRNGVRPVFDEYELGLTEYKTEEEYKEAQKTMHESGVYVSLEHLDSTKHFALVMDVTGSMGSSIAAMLSWIKENNASLPFSSFTFFNDGDNKDSSAKPIGKAGGIYSTRSIHEVNQVVETAMRKGSGGPELSENDMEAVLKAIEIDSTATDILLIGDNYSDIRDIRLLDNISKPVHVLLCAAPTKIRTEYLDIAKQTGGKFYLNGEIIELLNTKDGETIVIQGYSYSFNGRKFRLVERKSE